MLAMIHVLVRDGLVDQAYVDEHTVGFPDLAEHVRGLDASARSPDLRRRPGHDRGARP
jgi:anaerobic selenocysteine-containing dehydrogenase